MKIIENFLNKDLFYRLKSIVFSETFPYFYKPNTGSRLDKSDFFFSHILYFDKKQESPYFNDLLMPILGNLKYNYLIRAKINCYTIKSKAIYTEFHRDYDFDHQVALFSFNTCNGFTYFKDTKEKIKSVENQMLLFDGNKQHCSVAQTDTSLRINLNINFSGLSIV